MKILLFFISLLSFAMSTAPYKVTETYRNSSSVLLTLAYIGEQPYYVKPTSPIINTLTFLFHTHSYSQFIVKITDQYHKRFQVPQTGPFPADPSANFSFPISASAVTFEYTEEPFDFRIKRKSTQAILFSTYDRAFVFSEHYLQIGTQVDSEYLYGLGERFSSNFRIKDGKWTMFTRQQGFTIDKGDGRNAYGYYPFYLMREKDNYFHINYLRSSNAMDVIKESAHGRHYLTYKVIGGVFDFRFFVGEQDPAKLLQQFNFYCGGAALPPFWSLGFHQSRWGYQNVSYLQEVIDSYQQQKIPLDGIWSDIDYMLDLEDFTIDESRFPIQEMQAIRQRYRWIPIIDAGIKASGSIYEEGLRRNVYIRDPSGEPYMGKVWPGDTTFVDFFHPNATQFWIDMLDLLYKKIPFDGLWLDMNEIDNFCNGPCQKSGDPSIFDYSKDLPYNPGHDSIESQTISLNCTHYGLLSEANVHVYHGHLTTYASNQFFKSKSLRPFLITRSSTIGTGKYGFHWTGDNFADWQFLKESIPHIFNAQMFGFQMVGADICGFGGDASEELCARWYQLGSLYPFSRSHNIIGTVSQQPYSLGPIVLEASIKAIRLRYSLLKHFYTLFVTQKGLGGIWNPLFLIFPQDSNLYLDEIANSEFLIGKELLGAPIVQEGESSRKVYFPGGNWYSLYSGTQYAPGMTSITGYDLKGHIPLFLRAGAAILLQDVENVTSSRELNNIFRLYTGFSIKKQVSTSSSQIYEANGRILSIGNYEQDNAVDLCIRDSCYYSISLVLNVQPAQKTLELTVDFTGNPSLKDQIQIIEMALYYNNGISRFRLPTPLRVKGPLKTTIPVPDDSEAQKAQLLAS